MIENGLHTAKIPPKWHEDIGGSGEDESEDPHGNISACYRLYHREGQQAHDDPEQHSNHAVEIVGCPDIATRQEVSSGRFDNKDPGRLSRNANAVHHEKAQASPSGKRDHENVAKSDASALTAEPLPNAGCQHSQQGEPVCGQT